MRNNDINIFNSYSNGPILILQMDKYYSIKRATACLSKKPKLLRHYAVFINKQFRLSYIHAHTTHRNHQAFSISTRSVSFKSHFTLCYVHCAALQYTYLLLLHNVTLYVYLLANCCCGGVCSSLFCVEVLLKEGVVAGGPLDFIPSCYVGRRMFHQLLAIFQKGRVVQRPRTNTFTGFIYIN